MGALPLTIKVFALIDLVCVNKDSNLMVKPNAPAFLLVKCIANILSGLDTRYSLSSTLLFEIVFTFAIALSISNSLQ